MKAKGKLMGLDIGWRNVGVAVCDENQTIAFSRGELNAWKNQQELIVAIQKICQEEHINGIIIGLPLSSAGKPTQQTEKIKRFGRKLEEVLDDDKEQKIVITYQDESFTSFEADKLLQDQRIKKKNSQHELAATLILQRYIDRI